MESSQTVMSRSLNESEKLDIMKMFPTQSIDFKGFKVQVDSYVQTSKQTVDNAWDSRADFYIPNSGTFIKSWWISGLIDPITTAGQLIAWGADDAADLLNWVLPRSTVSLLQDVYILNNNSTGETLFEINTNAGHVLDLKL